MNNLDEKLVFSAAAKKKLFLLIGAGLVLLTIGIFMAMNSGSHGHEAHGLNGSVESQLVAEHTPEHGDAHTEVKADVKTEAHAGHETHEEHGHGPALWVKRLWKNLWHNNVFFAGIALLATFFVAFNHVAWAGWSAGIKRVAEAFGYWLAPAGIIMVLIFLFGSHSLFHWTHDYLYDPANPEFDEILNGKKGFLNYGFFLGRIVLYFVLWIGVWFQLRKFSLKEDETGDIKWYDKSVIWSAGFLVIFGVTESTSSWDWVMSIDPHFFSTMFGWYVLASWFVSALAFITLVLITLKENGYLSFINQNHFHDMGKFMFAFSIFWTYVWFEQFLLIYYANIPEEAGWMLIRLKSDAYTPIFFLNLFVNFFFPFLVLMTRDSKRQMIILKIVAIIIICGHWMDFYLMMTPPILGLNGGLDASFLFFEVGMFMVFLGLFLFVLIYGLSRAGLVAKNHPMIQESVNHHVW